MIRENPRRSVAAVEFSGVECGHDSPGSSRHPSLSDLQEAAGFADERQWREPEVLRVPTRLSGAGQHSHSFGR